MKEQFQSPFAAACGVFFRDKTALIGLAGVAFLLFFALFAPLIANGRPLIMVMDNEVSFPFLRTFFAPDSTEVMVEKIFNYAMLLILLLPVVLLLPHRWRKIAALAAAAALVLPFGLTKSKMDKTDFRALAANADWVLFAPVPYSPDEFAGAPCEAPGAGHLLGCDDIGRDLASRLIYGGRVSLAVGLLSTVIAMLIGIAVGMTAGYYRGWFDLTVMRLVEVMLCFPTFLLLLILMTMLGDHKISQSIPLVIAVLGLTGWLQLAFLVRGEVLKQSALPYIQSCVVSGVADRHIMFRHLLPNIIPPVLISFTFAISGAILGESGLSFLGFGVQPPTASWGNLLRQSFNNSLFYWHLTLFPGLALFIAVLSFNFTGEGLRRAFDSGGTR